MFGKKTSATLMVYGGMIKYIINFALYLAHYDAYCHINDEAKCRYLSVTNKFIFSHNSLKLLPHEALEEVCFVMDTLIQIICFSN